MAERILVVDDDRQLTDSLERFLSKQGYSVVSAGSATQMGLVMEQGDFDLVILDVGLPDVDGFEVTRQLRKNSQLPIVLLTVRDEVYDKIIGLEMGADDYVAKPFEPRELLARIRAVLRRSAGGASGLATANASSITFDGFEIQTKRRQVSAPDGTEVALTSTEYALLVALANRAGDVARRDSLMDMLYSGSVHVTERAIDAHIVRIRRKLVLAGGSETLIKTVHGVGYAIAAKVDAL